MFRDRIDAGRQLSEKIRADIPEGGEPVVLAVPRGGLPVGAIVAHSLNAPLDIMLTKKIGAPHNPEFAIGAVTLQAVFIDPEYDTPAMHDYVKNEIKSVRALLAQRESQYRRGLKPLSLQGRTVIVVDDGAATGHTLLVAVLALKKEHPKQIIVAVPVISPEAVELLTEQGAHVIAVMVPPLMQAIGAFYDEFAQVSDAQAMQILQSYHQKRE